MCAIRFSDLEGVLEYVEPQTLAEACSLLSQYQKKAQVIAGGTELVARLKGGQTSPEILINLMAIPNLDEIAYSGEQELKIGALATLHELENSSAVRGKYQIISNAVHEVLSSPGHERWVYYMVTIGGTLLTAASSFVAPALAVLGSKVKIQGPKGWRTVQLEDFFTSSGQTILQSDEILTEIDVQNPPPDAGLVYARSESTEDTPAISVATLLKLDPGHSIVEDVKIVIGGLTPAPFKAINAEESIKGKGIEERLLRKGARLAGAEITEGQEVVKKFVAEALLQAADDAVGDFALGY
jgi:CO/xanthine dehydrogenase FAD-binding subunit